MNILNFLIGLFSLASLVGLFVFPILAIVHLAKEAKVPAQKKHSKALVYLILTGVSFFALVFSMGVWSVLSYALSVVPVYM